MLKICTNCVKKSRPNLSSKLQTFSPHLIKSNFDRSCKRTATIRGNSVASTRKERAFHPTTICHKFIGTLAANWWPSIFKH